MQTGLINSNKIKAAGKTLLWLILQWPVYFFLLKIKGAVHRRNLGDWGEFGCLERKATKICMLMELVSKILYMKFCFCDVISHMIRTCGSKKIFIVEIKLN